MSPDRDPGRFDEDGREVDVDDYEDDSPRSLFSALWFRALLAVLVLGVLAAVAVPYILDFATTPALKSQPKPPAAPPATTAPTAAPVAPTATATPPSPQPAPLRERAKSEPAPAAVTKPAAAKPASMVAKAVETPKPAPKATATTQPSPAKAGGSAAGPYWVQVGAFKDGETAKRLAVRLREQGLRVEESTGVAARPSAAPPAWQSSANRYDVVVAGGSTADLDAKLTFKGLRAESTPNGIVVRPSMALRDAVSLSRDLADAGLSVQVRRVGGPAASPAPVAAETGGEMLHRVRVGGFADRAAATVAMKQLEDKGFKPFIARANE